MSKNCGLAKTQEGHGANSPGLSQVAQQREDGDAPFVLTGRQRQLICLIEFSVSEIAARLGIASSTVRNHFSVLYTAVLGPYHSLWAARNQKVLVLLEALRHGLVSLDDIEEKERPDDY